jgi:hypothetical protein
MQLRAGRTACAPVYAHLAQIVARTLTDADVRHVLIAL